MATPPIFKQHLALDPRAVEVYVNSECICYFRIEGINGSFPKMKIGWLLVLTSSAEGEEIDKKFDVTENPFQP